jgi:hypothetical protein
MRQLAEEVLGVADTAQERLPPPSEPTAEADTIVAQAVDEAGAPVDEVEPPAAGEQNAPDDREEPAA